MLVKKIIVNSGTASRGNRMFCLRTTLIRLGCLYEAIRKRREALRCRLMSEGQGSSGFENRAETRRFYGADFCSGLKLVTESVVLTRAPDVISA
ncbi:hypothetical protein Pan241w_51020 [Gimesia alba]|uniref:Uncharacterized protein n=1 Tax=Gimesia alba TaxID=2527973 RepID=A0A517RM80_9PLAN|nr:hypothetical protein Pan241w_51020 [Gimesia alba]